MKYVIGLLVVSMMQSAVATERLPRSEPEAQGISSAAILDFVKALDQEIDVMNSVMLVRHGHVVAEGWWSPYEPNDPHMLYSLSKSFTSTAVGIAIAERRLTLDDTILSFFPEDAPPDPSDNLKAMRVRDLLSMSTGHHQEDLRTFSFDSAEPLTKQFLALPVAHKPGTHFLYNTPATYICSAIIQKVTGEKLIDYLRPRLFAPLGVEQPTWSESAQGICHGGFGLSVTTEDIACFGQMYLQRGEWQGHRILPADWIADATSRQTSNGSNPKSDWDQGYGYQFWRCRYNAYRGDGAFGQYCVVMPEYDAVLVITSGVRDMQSVLNIVWDKLLPEMRSLPLPARPADHSELTATLAKLQVPGPEAQQSPRDADNRWGKTYTFPENDRQLRSIAFEIAPTGATLIFCDDQGERRIPCGNAHWPRTRVSGIGSLDSRVGTTNDVGLAANGAWTSDDTYRVRLCLFETPFYQDMSFRFKDHTVVVSSKYNVAFGPTEQTSLTGQSK